MKKINIKNYGWLYVISAFIFTSFFFPRASIAAINIPWSTTFDCAAESTQYNGTLCDGLKWGGAWFFGNYRTQITSVANNPNGGGGRGARFWIGDGVNANTGTITVTFTSPQKELWIRWYMRYEAGFQWGKLYYDKNLYIYTGVPNISVIPEFYSEKYVVIAQATPNYYQVQSTNEGGWSSIMGGNKSDGKFHAYEIHLKMDTDGTNGEGQLWIDGVLRASNTSVDWSNGNAKAQQGWVNFHFNSNQKSPNNGGAEYVDYDDIAVYNSMPPKRDTDGNPFIGLFGDKPVRRTLASNSQVLPPKNFLLVK